MQVDVVGHLLWVVVLKAFAPVVADGVRVDAAVAVEGAAGDGCRLISCVCCLCHGLQPLLAVLVPEVVGTITACRWQQQRSYVSKSNTSASGDLTGKSRQVGRRILSCKGRPCLNSGTDAVRSASFMYAIQAAV